MWPISITYLSKKLTFSPKYATQTSPLNFLLKYVTETGNVHKYKVDTFYMGTIQGKDELRAFYYNLLVHMRRIMCNHVKQMFTTS